MNGRGLKLGLLLTIVVLPSCRQAEAPPGPTLTFKYVKEQEGGCANLYLYKGTADRLEVLWISADKEKLKLPVKGSRTFDLAAAPDGLLVAVDVWKKAPRFGAYCNDIAPDAERLATWKAKKGTLVLTVAEPEPGGEAGPKTYKASARLENVDFEDDAGHRATLKDETIHDARVGWFAG
jgi:hypothetical protein